jgi:NAD+ synthetase
MKDYAGVVAVIRRELGGYVHDNKLRALVIGISGGIDSALCAALAEPVCKSAGIPLFGRSIPIQTNKPDEIYRARVAGGLFCTDFMEVDCSQLYSTIAPVISSDHAGAVHDRSTKVRQGNIKARIRMLVLYDLAAKHGGLVLSTDNLTEYNLGFWTLHGDHADYGLIQHLWKTEVYELAEQMVKTYTENGDDKRAQALRISIDAVPTDGLGISSSDCEQFGVCSYADVDDALKTWLRLKRNPEANRAEIDKLRNNPVVLRHEGSHFKRNWPIAIARPTLGIGDIV